MVNIITIVAHIICRYSNCTQQLVFIILYFLFEGIIINYLHCEKDERDEISFNIAYHITQLMGFNNTVWSCVYVLLAF